MLKHGGQYWFLDVPERLELYTGWIQGGELSPPKNVLIFYFYFLYKSNFFLFTDLICHFGATCKSVFKKSSREFQFIQNRNVTNIVGKFPLLQKVLFTPSQNPMIKEKK